MLKAPSSPSSSYNAAIVDNAQTLRSRGLLLGASLRPAVANRRRNAAVFCASSSSSSSPCVRASVLEKDGSVLEKSVSDRLRLGSLTEDGLSYKEKFIVRCYEVGINKTATVETIANLLQVIPLSLSLSLSLSV